MRGFRVCGIIGLCWLLPALLGADVPSFYLSTDRIFSSKDEVVVKVESKDLKNVDLRIYQIKNPQDFFLRQKNVYQAEGYGKRSPGIRQLAGALFRAVRRDSVVILKEKVDYFRLQEQLRIQVRAKLGEPRPQKPLVLSRVRGYLTEFPLVEELTTALEPGQGNWNYNLIRLPVYREGVYLIEGISGKDAGYCVAVISDLAVLSRHSVDKALFYSVNRLSGSPVPGNMLLYRPGSGGRMHRSGKDGITELREKALLLGQVYAMAQAGSGFSLHDATFYPSSSFSVNPHKVFLYTDRPVYKPGQKLYFKGVIRRYQDQKYWNDLPAGGEYDVKIIDHAGKEQGAVKARAGSFGTVDGGWDIPDATEPGMYRVILSYQDRKYESVFRIEHYVKPPFLVNVEPEKSSYSFNDRIKGRIRVRYFFGEPVKGAKVSYFVYRMERFQSMHFGEPYGWYLQDNEYRNTREEMVYEGKGESDSDGDCEFSFTANMENLKGSAYTYRIEARVLDSSGRMVIGSTSLRVLQGQFYLLLDADKNHFLPEEEATFRIKAVSYSGGAVKPDVWARVYWYEWTSEYMARPAQEIKLFEKQVDLSAGDSFTYKFDRKGHFRVELYAKDSAGNEITTGRFFWVAGNADQLTVHTSGLKLVPDKKVYKPGDTARVLVVSPVPGARLFHTLEGDTIYRHGVVQMQGNSVVLEIPVTAELMPNAFLNVAFVFNDRIYQASQQLFIPPASRFLSYKTEGLKERYRPGEEVDFRIRAVDMDGKGVAAELSLAVTDEAIFSVQGQIVLDIEKFFYHPHRNNVLTASSFTTRFYGYSDEDRLAMSRRFLPDTALASFNKGKSPAAVSDARKVFKDRAFWEARLTTAADGWGRVRFTLPDNITAWRFQVVGVDNSARVGGTQFSRISRKEFFVRSVFPEKATEGEKLRLGAVLHNLGGSEVQARISLAVTGGKASGGQEQTVSVPARGERKVFWDVEVGSGEKLVMLVNAAGPHADSVERSIPVLPFAKTLQKNWHGPVTAGKRLRFQLANDQELSSALLTVRVSPGIVYLIQDSLKYLVSYPYGCVEQTLSRFIPNLYVMQLMEKLPFEDAFLKDKLPGLTRMGITQLATLQNTDGSWGWFMNDKPDTFMTAYAVYCLGLASGLGYGQEVKVMLQRGARYLERLIRQEAGLDPRVRAFVLFALQRYENKYASLVGFAMDQLKTDDRMSGLLLANAAAGTRYDSAGKIIVQRWLGELRARLSTEGLQTASLEMGGEGTEWQSDSNFANALLLRLMVRHRFDKERCRQVANHLLSRREGEGWQSTLDTAFILAALAEYSTQYEQQTGSASFRCTLNGRDFTVNDVGRGKMITLPVSGMKRGQNSLTVKGAGDLLYTASLRWHQRGGIFNPQSGGIQVARRYFKLGKRPDGRYFVEREYRTEALPKGSPVLVRIQLHAAKVVDYLMVDDALPSGFQVLEERDANLVAGVPLQNYLSRSIYPDRAVFFRRYLPAGDSEIAYIAVPTLAGKFKVLPATASSMYYPDLAGSSGGRLLDVAGE